MVRTQNLRRQHDSALALVEQIGVLSDRIARAPNRDDAYAITMLFAKLTGLLQIHFAQEDKLLYPSLMASGRGGVAEMAQRFFREMGQLGPTYMEVAERWRAVDVILADSNAFLRETRALFAALGDRIRRENEELYPLADAMADDQSAPRAA